MGPHRRRNCLHCGALFHPDRRNLRHQRYCSKAQCRQASKAASQRRWLAKAENLDYLVRDGHIIRCDSEALALYLFLMTVADAQGLSFYGDGAITRLLAFSPQRLAAARSALVRAGLIAYEAPLYQVLALEPAGASDPTPALIATPAPARSSCAPGQLRAMREILRRAGVAS